MNEQKKCFARASLMWIQSFFFSLFFFKSVFPPEGVCSFKNWCSKERWELPLLRAPGLLALCWQGRTCLRHFSIQLGEILADGFWKPVRPSSPFIVGHECIQQASKLLQPSLPHTFLARYFMRIRVKHAGPQCYRRCCHLKHGRAKAIQRSDIWAPPCVCEALSHRKGTRAKPLPLQNRENESGTVSYEGK